MKKRYLIPILLVTLIVGGILGGNYRSSSDKYEQQIIELQKQNEKLRGRLDTLSAEVGGLKQQKQSSPSYQTPLPTFQNPSYQPLPDEWQKQEKQREIEKRLKDLEYQNREAQRKFDEIQRQEAQRKFDEMLRR